MVIGDELTVRPMDKDGWPALRRCHAPGAVPVKREAAFNCRGR